MPASLGFMVEAILGILGSQTFLHLGVLSVRLSKWPLVFISACSMRSNCLLYLVVVSILVLLYPIMYCFQRSVGDGRFGARATGADCTNM